MPLEATEQGSSWTLCSSPQGLCPAVLPSQAPLPLRDFNVPEKYPVHTMP